MTTQPFPGQARMVVRLAKGSMLFAVPDASQPAKVAFEPYVMKSGMSVAANLREAFKTANLLSVGYKRAIVLLDTQPLILPIDECKEEEVGSLYQYTFAHYAGENLEQSVLPGLNAVAVYPVNKDLNLVLHDNFADVKFGHVMQPLWKFFHHRSGYARHHRLHAYFHDRKLDLFSFDKKRFRFCNVFETESSRDSLFFILHAWQQLGFDAEQDELYVAGYLPDEAWLLESLRHYVKKVYAVSPSAEFNRSPITAIKGMPFDLAAYMIAGR